MRELAYRQVGGLTAVVIAVLLLAVVAVATPPPRAHAQTGCVSTIDFMLVLDGSESISSADFDLMRTFAGSLVGHFTISPSDAHAGIVQFASEGQGRVEIGLSSDLAAIQAAASAMTQIIGGTDIQEGIALAQGELIVAGRAGVPQVLIVLTDGEHNQPGDPVAEAEAARAQGTEIFAIAVGAGPDLPELSAIASDPDTNHVFAVSDFDTLVTILEPLVQVVCPPTPTAPPPTALLTPVLGVEHISSGLTLPSVGIEAASATTDDQRGATRMAQAFGGLGIALFLASTSYWFARRRARH